MTSAGDPVTKPGPAGPARPRPALRFGRDIGRAAAVIGGITVIARLLGFGRQLAFAHTVGSTCLGTAYATANQVPNIIYDIVLGGALTSAVVPVLAGAATHRVRGQAVPMDDHARQEADAEASQIASALLTWTVLLLAPASLAIAAVSGPLAPALLAGAPGCGRAATAAVSSRMLAVFAPQILFYGLAVVCYGIVQAHRRFTAPALAPVLSSLVVIAAYVAFVPLGNGDQNRLAMLPRSAELMLSAGTTAGVAALFLTALGPTLRLRLRLRPALRFPPGVARRVRALAVVGVGTLLAQDAALVAVIVLANGHGGRGALVLYGYGWQMFFTPYAILAVPIATTAFPVLSANGGADFDRTSATAARAVTLASWLGLALLAGAAVPAARLFVPPAQARQLAISFIAFAPGLVGYGLAATLSRVLFASDRSRVVGFAVVGGWLAVIAVDVAVVPMVPAHWVAAALALGNTVGLSGAGLALWAAVRAVRGDAAVRGTGRAAGAGLAGAVAGVVAGMLVSASLPVSGLLPNASVAVLASTCSAIAFAAVVLVLDGGDLRAVVARVAGRMG